MSSTQERTRRGEVPSAYIKSDADYWRNDRERQRLKLRLRTAKNASTARALRRRDEAAACWRGRRDVAEIPGGDQVNIAAAIRFCEAGGTNS
jgi:hypothetical protein